MKSNGLSARNELRLAWLGLCSGRLSAPEPIRSAAPLAAAGIVCLGLVPILGGPERPLHWAMTVGIVGFGSLLWARRHLGSSERPLQSVPPLAAKQAGRTLLLLVGVIAALVGVIVGLRVHSGGSFGALSLLLPAAGLAWVTVLALQVLRRRAAAGDALAAGDRPSRRPPQRDALAKPTSTSSHPGPPDRHVSA